MVRPFVYLLGLLAGVVLIVIGGILIPVFQKKIRREVIEGVIIKNGSAMYDSWRMPPYPIYMHFYVFNLKNAYEVVQYGDKPIFEENGPYTYREHREKFNITFENGTISYREDKTYVFDRALSSSSEDDNVTTVNVPMMTIANMLRFQYAWIQELADVVLDVVGETLFMTLPVKKLIWGYQEPLITRIKNLLKPLGITLPMDNVFGLFYKKNNSNDGLYTIYSGERTIDKLAMIQEWNKKSCAIMQQAPDQGEGPHLLASPQKVLRYGVPGMCTMFAASFSLSPKFNGWNVENKKYPAVRRHLRRHPCSKRRFIEVWHLAFPDGSVFPPFLRKDSKLYIFSTDVCRSLYVLHESQSTVKDIKVYEFIAPGSIFLNASANPANEGFCTPNCLPSGLLNVSVCQQGAPIVLSQPHFYQADEKIVKAVIGLVPNKRKHQTKLDIEPTTGIAMKIAKKLQINVCIETVKHILATAKIPKLFFPVLWINENAEIDDDSAAKFQKKVSTPIKISESIEFGLITIGGLIFFFVLLFLLIRLSRIKNDYQQLEGHNNPTSAVRSKTTDGESNISEKPRV